jgi:hypothetical protein
MFGTGVEIGSNEPAARHACRVAVIGPCASGKSTLVTALRERGYDAHAPAQEHSVIAELWRHVHPDVLVALTVEFDAVQRRRGARWPEWLYQVQKKRLAAAYAAADMTIDTTTLAPSELVAEAITLLEGQGWQPNSIAGERGRASG